MPITRQDLEMIHTKTSAGEPGCGKRMFPVAIRSNVKASEWYCRGCHDSVLMDFEVAEHFLSMEVQKKNG